MPSVLRSLDLKLGPAFREEEDAAVSYKATQKEFPVPYVIYVDF